jgi:hypothetical protein
VLVLLAYGSFIITTYLPYLDSHLRLCSPELAGLPEDAIGYGFWMWWPMVSLAFVMSLALAMSAIQPRFYAAMSFLSVFALLSVADYFLYQQLVRQLISP